MNDKDPILSGRMMFYGDGSFHASVVRVLLVERPDSRLLQEAVEEAAKRCPWTTYGVREEGGLFYYRDQLSPTLRVCEWDDDNPPVLGGPQADGHLLGVYNRGRELLFAFFHGLTDGAGIFSFVDEVLRCYAALLAGDPLPPAGPTFEDTEAEPMLCMDQALAEAGIAWDPQVMDASQQQPAEFATQDSMLVDGANPRTYLVRANAEQIMAFANGLGIKPSAALITLYASAFLQVHPEARGALRVAMPIDFRGVLGIPHTFRNCAMPPAMLDIPIVEGESIDQLAARINQIVLQHVVPAAKLLTVKGFAGYMDMIPRMPYAQTEQMLSQYMASGSAPFTFNCSYAHRFQKEEYLDLLESVYVQTSSFGPSTVLVVIALPNSFCITLNQGGSSETYLRAYLDQLEQNGIAASLEHTMEGPAPYVELRETLGFA